VGAARSAVRRAWLGLIQVVAGPDPAPVRPWRSAQERRAADTAMAIVTVALVAISVITTHAYAPPATPVLPELGRDLLAGVVVAPLPLALRRPLLAWRIGWLGLLVVPLAGLTWWGGWPWGPPQVLAVLAAFFLAGIRCQRAGRWWLWALTLIPWCLWLSADVANLNGPVTATVALTAGAVAVDSIGLRLQTQRALVVQTVHTQAERARRAVLEERARIARELHDVVAHHMSLIAVQAETAPYRLSDLPESARAEFGALSGTAREALAQMRQLLGVLRADQPAGLTPQPVLSDLPALVDAARRAGIAVELSVADGLEVPAGVGLCAYRIVQESLSNAGQHAPGAAVTVSVDRSPGAVVLRIANGPGAAAEDHRGPGHGLTGMRERVALLGGSLTVGPAPGGGFEVSAVLPLGVGVAGAPR
jgi:signal transduction histidine kinase